MSGTGSPNSVAASSNAMCSDQGTSGGFFSLRDGCSASPDRLTQFGLLRDDYTPKPAFEAYRRLIAELGV